MQRRGSHAGIGSVLHASISSKHPRLRSKSEWQVVEFWMATKEEQRHIVNLLIFTESKSIDNERDYALLKNERIIPADFVVDKRAVAEIIRAV